MHFTSKILHTVCLALDTNWEFHTLWHSQISRYVERYGSWPVWSNHRLKAMGKILLVVTGKVRGAIAHWSGYAIIYNIVCWQAVHIKLLFLKVPHSFPDWLYFAAVFYIFVITVSHWTFTSDSAPTYPSYTLYEAWPLLFGAFPYSCSHHPVCNFYHKAILLLGESIDSVLLFQSHISLGQCAATERMNGILKNHITKLMIEPILSWIKCLHLILQI